MGKRRGEKGGHEDQFGEYGGSQDREVVSNFSSGKGQKGGGTAGASGRKDANLSFQRVVPKFLQQYSHLLPQHAPPEDEDAPVVLDQHGHQEGGGRKGEEDGSEEQDEREEALEAVRTVTVVMQPWGCCQPDLLSMAEAEAGGGGWGRRALWQDVHEEDGVG